MFLAAVEVQDGIDVGALVCQTLSEMQMAHKEAGIICGYRETDRSGFSRALSGEQPLDLWRMRHLPLRFWQLFFPVFIAALVREWVTSVVRDARTIAGIQRRGQQQGTHADGGM